MLAKNQQPQRIKAQTICSQRRLDDKSRSKEEERCTLRLIRSLV